MVAAQHPLAAMALPADAVLGARPDVTTSSELRPEGSRASPDFVLFLGQLNGLLKVYDNDWDRTSRCDARTWADPAQL